MTGVLTLPVVTLLTVFPFASTMRAAKSRFPAPLLMVTFCVETVLQLNKVPLPAVPFQTSKAAAFPASKESPSFASPEQLPPVPLVVSTEADLTPAQPLKAILNGSLRLCAERSDL